MIPANLLIASLAGAAAVSATPTVHKRCTGFINSIADVPAAKNCTNIVINSFTVPAQTIFDMTKLLPGTHVRVNGDVTWTGEAIKGWLGPLFTIDGTNITFDGRGHTFDGQGKKYWDGLGGNGGVDKPKFMRVTMSGTFSDLKILNSPKHVYSIGNNKGPLLLEKLLVDNTAGDELMPSGITYGHNSDCFDVSATGGTTIRKSKCKNQDDCLAINSGNNIKFLNNYCSGGHGISIGSIASGKTVSNVLISKNTVVRSENGLRIKTVVGATNASVSDITYESNDVSGITVAGLIIQQDYLNGGPTGQPSDDVPIKNIVFSGGRTKISVNDGAKPIYILCGANTCENFDFTKLTATGGRNATVVPEALKTQIKGLKL